MPSDTAIGTNHPRAIGIATALMSALAGGAVWCLLSLYSRSELAGFAFVVAVVVAWTLRTHGFAGSRIGAFVAAACVLLAAIYAACLQAVAQIASLLGLSMRATLLQMDPSMALAIARANLSGWSAAIVASAIALAILLMLRGNATRR